MCFFIPAAIAIAMSGLLLVFLRDTPESVGLPEIAGTHVPGGDTAADSPAQFKQFLWDRVFSNKYIWLVSAANFFVYTIRFAVFDWGPTMLKEVKGANVVSASWMVFGFELAGLAGMLATGYLTDRWFRGRGAPLSLFCMLMCGLSIFLFWKVTQQSCLARHPLLMSTGFFVYGPQALVAVVVGQPRHQARRRHRRRPHQYLRLRQHRALRLGHGTPRPTLRLVARLRLPDRRGNRRRNPVRRRPPRQSPRLRRTTRRLKASGFFCD